MTRRGFCLLILGTVTAAGVGTRRAPGQSAPKPVAPAALSPADAEKLFLRMEAAVVKAKTLDVAFEGTFEGTLRGTLKGTLVCGPGNRVHEELDGDLVAGPGPKTTIAVRMTSDGKRMVTTTALGQAPQDLNHDLTEVLGEAQRLFTARAGVVAPVFLIAEHVPAGQKPKALKPAEFVRVRDVRPGMAAKPDGRDTRVIDYTLTCPTLKEPVAATVWLDAETNLPVKRVLQVKQEGMAVTLTETYSKVAVDGMIDEKKFELPKR